MARTHCKASIMDPTSRLRIATRIHFLLLRQMGAGIDVGYMLRRNDYAREVLFVCEGSGDAELASLARRFERASREEAAAATQETAPAADELQFAPATDFGPSGLADIGAATGKPPSRLLSSRWLTRLGDLH
jgi:hypothetical protein